MATPSSRTEFKDYCLRSLGFPVIDINVDDDQVEDRVDEALQTYAEFHYDATHADYLAIKMTADQLANSANAGSNTFGWIPLPSNVIGVARMFPLTGDVVHGGGSSANFNIFDLNYQLRLNELYEFTSSSYQYYWIARTHIRMLEIILTGVNPIRYSKHMGRVYIDMAWNAPEVPANTYLLLECTTLLSPEEFPRVWNDKWLKEYGTTLIKRQWGENMKKYGNYTLPGGMIINGQGIYDEAINEQRRLEQVLRDTWEEPPQFLIG